VSRVDKLAVEDLDEAQRALYDSIAGGRRTQGTQVFALTDDVGRLEGPFNAMLFSPPVGAALQALGTAVRYGSSFTDRAREIAILVVAHFWDSEFEIYAHEAVGLAAGLTSAELQAIRDQHYELFTDATERLVARTAWALTSAHDLGDEEYDDAQRGLGAALLFELTTLVGYYATLALQLAVFRVDAPSM
jgi:4-carboxymuconolactone decarboxylase